MNFNVSDFNCKCGCEMPIEVEANIKKLIEQLQIIRNVVGMPIYVNSGYRCEAHNKRIGGVKNSKHILGMAADITARNMPINELHKTVSLLDEWQDIEIGGVGFYPNKNFIHIDIYEPNKKRRWVK